MRRFGVGEDDLLSRGMETGRRQIPCNSTGVSSLVLDVFREKSDCLARKLFLDEIFIPLKTKTISQLMALTRLRNHAAVDFDIRWKPAGEIDCGRVRWNDES